MMPRYDTFWRRFFAGVIDGWVFMPLNWLQQALIDRDSSQMVELAWSLLLGFAPIVYSVGMHLKLGQTLGKMATGVQVLDVSETRLMTLRQSCLRDIGVIVPQVCVAIYEVIACFVDVGSSWVDVFGTVLGSSVLIWFLIEVLTMLTNDKRRAFHDQIAGSVVVRKEA